MALRFFIKIFAPAISVEHFGPEHFFSLWTLWKIRPEFNTGKPPVQNSKRAFFQQTPQALLRLKTPIDISFFAPATSVEHFGQGHFCIFGIKIREGQKCKNDGRKRLGLKNKNNDNNGFFVRSMSGLWTIFDLESKRKAQLYIATRYRHSDNHYGIHYFEKFFKGVP